MLLYIVSLFIILDCLVGLVVASTTADQEVIGTIPVSDKVLLGVAITESPVWWQGSHHGTKNLTCEMWVYRVTPLPNP